MEYKNKYANKFKEDMNKIIKTWEGYETSFYNNTIIPICKQDVLLNYYLLGGKEKFPHNLYMIWVLGPKMPDNITPDLLERLYSKFEDKQYTVTISGGATGVDKGKKFENYMDLMSGKNGDNNYILQLLADKLPGHLEHVGQKNKREDFVLTDEFSIDIKYSGLQNDDRFKDIIKPFGNSIYASITQIEEGILRSMYKEGASQGLFNPKATGQTKHLGLFYRDKKTREFKEVTKEDYEAAMKDTGRQEFGTMPSLRKNIIYIFNDDGYWASFCLRKVSDWAASRIENLGFSNSPKEKNYNPYEFWDFSKDEWNLRRNFYGSNR